jgi:hypothetical protein
VPSFVRKHHAEPYGNGERGDEDEEVATREHRGSVREVRQEISQVRQMCVAYAQVLRRIVAACAGTDLRMKHEIGPR